VSGLRSALEERVVAAVRQTEDELVGLTADLVGFDTTARNDGDPPREEAALQGYLKRRLEALGADTDLWEPEPTGKGNLFVPDDLEFRGRPQLAARLAGRGGGRSLLLNGHIDAVNAEPLERWSSDPFRAAVRDGRLYGRGSCDMKGGIAGFLHALEVLHTEGVRLAGDVVWATNTDEESTGAGAYAVVARGIEADAGLCGEPTDLDTWVACRGGFNVTVTIEGRAGHAECAQPHWTAGGAVNAIEKQPIVLDAVRRLREEWRTRPDQQHPYLSPADMVPTIVRGGEWMVTHPSQVELTFDTQYMPNAVGADGTGAAHREEVRRWIDAAAAADPWLAEHPLRWDWGPDIVPAEVPDDHEIVVQALRAAADLGRRPKIDGLDSWHDAAVFTRRAATPTVSFGPGSIGVAHTIDEYVPVADLVDHCAATALILLRWCGTA
jgi:acetylornithine deacetylase